MTVSTKASSAQISGIASKAISQLLGTSLCVTTAYTTIPPATSIPVPSSTAPAFHTPAASNAAVLITDQISSSTSSTVPLIAPISSSYATSQTSQTISAQPSQTRLITTVTRPLPSQTEATPHPALAPSKRPPNNNDQNLKIVAGVVTTVLGIAAFALAFLLWRRCRRHRRGSSSTVGSFFFPPRLNSKTQGGHQISGSTAKSASIITAPAMSMRKEAHELAGETGSMDVRWRETYYEERKTIPQELKGTEPPRYEMDTQNSRRPSVSPLTP